jgi:UrcA family protein
MPRQDEAVFLPDLTTPPRRHPGAFMSRSINCLTLAALGVLGLLAAPLARADEVQTASQQVSFADLDLHSPAGVATLRHRIQFAARHVCGEPERFGSPDYASYESCRAAAERQGLKLSEQMIAAIRGEARFASAAPTN